MKKEGTYGEFFPISLSPFCYNETVSHEHFPLTKAQVLAKNWQWRDEKNDTGNSQTTNKEIKSCESCHKNFRLIPAELKFYEKHQLTIPQKCYTCRSKELLALRNPRKIWLRNCQKCQSPISTSYSPSRPETIYCEKCFLESLN